MLRLTTFATLLVLGLCADETISGYADTETSDRLTEIDGERITFSATISFPEAGRVSGRAPCNTYSATQTAPYPWFEMGRTVATRAACPDLDKEQEYLNLLRQMTVSEVSGGVLILSNDDGRQMVFQAEG